MKRTLDGSPEVITALQAVLAAEAHLNIQYRRDWRRVKVWGFKKVAAKLKDLGDNTHDFMKILQDRLSVLGGGDAEYTIGAINAPPSLTAVFQGELQLEQQLIDLGRTAIRVSVTNGDEATAEKMRHIEERHEDAAIWLEQQLNLIDGFEEDSGEARYGAEKL